ncbi:MAG: hypothetical protein ABIQ88_22385 [Chitinophagaceae bacterium]
MLHEKQTNIGKRLQDLDSVPGEAGFNKEAAWEKLHTRIGKQPANYKMAWYWAAASILLLLALPLLLKKTGKHKPGKELVQQKASPSLNIPPTNPGSNKLTVISATTNTNKVVPPYTHVVKRRYNGTANKKGLYKPFPLITFEPPATRIEIVAPVIKLSDKSFATAAIAPVKKKLPVVHINEMGKQEQENAQFASHREWPSFRKKILNNDNYPGASLPAGNSVQDVLTIKIPLKN